MKIRARSVRWQGADLGSLALDSERRAHGMIVKSLAINGENHTLALRGNWTRNPSRPYSTRIDGKVHIDSLGDLLEKLGGGGNIRDTTADLRFGLHWDGGPLNATPGKLGGELTVALGEGSLLDMEPGVGRVIGMLNLGTIWRRLNLDFSDLYGQGLAYDSISGTFRIEGGQAITDAFLIDGVASKILVSGRVGLVERNLDETVTVIPHTTAALPIAGALAGGPAVGAAVLVAQQLIGEEVDSITATQYSMRGSWKTPTITRINHNMPLDMLDSAWNGIRSWSGFGHKPEADRP
jgi:uncharacterized protein YhdP